MNPGDLGCHDRYFKIILICYRNRLFVYDPGYITFNAFINKTNKIS